jgi:large subunit ribosomal protein L22
MFRCISTISPPPSSSSSSSVLSLFSRSLFIDGVKTKYHKPLTEAQRRSQKLAKTTPNKSSFSKALIVPKAWRSPMEHLSQQKSRAQAEEKLINNNPPPKEPTFSFPAPPEPFISTARRSESRAIRRNIPISPQKLNEICRTVRGLSVEEALIQCKFSAKTKARIVGAAIHHAAIMGQNNFGMNFARLYVAVARVGPGTHLKRVDIKGRGRTGIKHKYYSHLWVKVREQASEKPPRKLPGMKHPVSAATHDENSLEQRIGRWGRTISTIQRQLAAVKAYAEAKKALRAAEDAKREAGLPAKRWTSLPLPRAKAQVTDYSAVIAEDLKSRAELKRQKNWARIKELNPAKQTPGKQETQQGAAAKA